MPRTELVWDGKYDAAGKRTVPFRTALPFQTVETVNESADERRSLFAAMGAEKPWRNRLIWGDKKFVMPALLPEFAGKIDLIYIDPLFDTGADFSFNATFQYWPDSIVNGMNLAIGNILNRSFSTWYAFTARR